MSHKTGYYIAAAFFALTALFSFAGGKVGAGLVSIILVIVFSVFANHAEAHSHH
jgi:hypothetical protein